MSNGNKASEKPETIDEQIRHYTTVLEKGLVLYFSDKKKLGTERIIEALKWAKEIKKELEKPEQVGQDYAPVQEFYIKVSNVCTHLAETEKKYQNTLDELAKKEELIKNIQNSAEIDIKKANEEKSKAYKELDAAQKKNRTNIEKVEKYTFEVSDLKRQLSSQEGVQQLYDLTKQKLDESYTKNNELETSLSETKKKVSDLEQKLEDTIPPEKLDELAQKKGYLPPAEVAKIKAAESMINEEYKKLQKDTDELREELMKVKSDYYKLQAGENKNNLSPFEADFLKGVNKESNEETKKKLEELEITKEKCSELQLELSLLKKKFGVEETEEDKDEKELLNAVKEDNKEAKPS